MSAPVLRVAVGDGVGVGTGVGVGVGVDVDVDVGVDEDDEVGDGDADGTGLGDGSGIDDGLDAEATLAIAGSGVAMTVGGAPRPSVAVGVLGTAFSTGAGIAVGVGDGVEVAEGPGGRLYDPHRGLWSGRSFGAGPAASAEKNRGGQRDGHKRYWNRHARHLCGRFGQYVRGMPASGQDVYQRAPQRVPVDDLSDDRPGADAGPLKLAHQTLPPDGVHRDQQASRRLGVAQQQLRVPVQ